jgi:deferrochelatase/peroxidase EfeB
LWGRPGQEADAVLLVYAADAPTLSEEVSARKSDIEQSGGRILHELRPKPLEERDPGDSGAQVAFEPFGFADGVSQPIIKGTRRWLRESDAIHTVEPGEFLLGYPDSRGFFPPSPSVQASADPENRLPLLHPVHSRNLYQPDFNQSGAQAPRDFGRNGTFLVVRQLDQKVEIFDTYLTSAAATYARHPAVPANLQTSVKEWLGAKIIGRWNNGTSLVRYPHRPGTPGAGQKNARPDNEFLYGAEDPLGERCPLGAHIRRTNPRDSLAPGSKDELSIVNRHRILRVGRSYEPQGSGDPNATDPGLLFMCLNADIERQFEFIQQTWSMTWQFHGLENEVDPILGRGGRKGDERKLSRLTIPSPNGPLHLTGIQDFVRVRGGGYFFMPGRQAIHYLSGL